MSAPLTAYADARRRLRCHRQAHVYRLTRADGTVLRFTDHDAALVCWVLGLDVGTAETFSPAGGFASTARQTQSELRDQNVDVRGVLRSSAITADDLRAGRYRECLVEEYLVDWRFPWMKYLRYWRYWTDETRFSGEEWFAQLTGLTRFLAEPVGQLVSKTCRAKFGSTTPTNRACNFNVAGVTVAGKVIGSVVTQRVVFVCTTTSLSATDGYYSRGTVTWTSGANSGLKSEVQLHEHNQPGAGNARVSLFLATPFDLAANDEFSIAPGCDKKAATCKAKFSNLVNFRGEPFVPGNDKLMESPP